MKCQNSLCTNDTKNPKFCSRSCAATANNMSAPKRKLQGKCLICKAKIHSNLKYCENHNKYSLLTIEDLLSSKYTGSFRFEKIRLKARYQYKNLKLPCENCGYEKHVEVCHKQPISSFPITTLISIVNHRNNIIFLCPNCHWEFDNGLLSI